jgi:hypothetical protein
VRLWDPVATSAGAIAAAIASNVWRRYRNRMAVLRCQISHTPAANTAGVMGDVKVQYGGIDAPNLYTCSVVVENDSSKDLSSVVLNLSYTDGTIFLSGGGAILGSTQFVPLAQSYLDRSVAFYSLAEEHRNVEEQRWLSAHRDYGVPVLNRGSRVQFFFTVHGLTGVAPKLTVSTDHLGVRLVLQAPRQLFMGEPNGRAIAVGLFACIVALLLLPTFIAPSWLVAWVMFWLGALVLVIGATLLKLGRGILRLLS